MTREEALEKAQTRVWCYMNKGDIDYYFDQYKLVVTKPDGRKKTKPTRSEKEDALITYLTDKMCNTSDEVVEKQQKAYEDRFKYDIEVITGHGRR